MEEAPELFKCPISMELMETPVTLATGVTYEKKNIEKWLFVYKKSTCPATMQLLQRLDLTPNHTLKRLITSWPDGRAQCAPRPSNPGEELDKLSTLLSTIESCPFKVSSLKKLQTAIVAGDEIQKDFVRLGGIQVLGRIIGQVGIEGSDFVTFRACEEALGVLRHLPLADGDSVKYLSRPECVKPMMTMLQRGSAEARLHTMAILQKMSGTIRDWTHVVSVGGEDMDIVKSLLELLSDEISTKLSSCSLDVLIEIVATSKKNRLKAIENGAVCVLIELLPDAGRHKCERIILLLKMLCDCPEGRSAFLDHGLGIAVVSKKILMVSEEATKLGVKVLWQICSFMPTEKALDDMMAFGAVRKLLGLLQIDGRSSTKEKALKIIRRHAGLWRHYRCFPSDVMGFLTSIN